MTLGDFLAGNWWVVLAVLGMGIGAVHIALSAWRARAAMEVLRAYAEQGREPPAEVLRVASKH
jgi:hypothetical protein